MPHVDAENSIFQPASVAAPVGLGTPVVTSRQWTTALAPRNGGGWDFITQSYNFPLDVPTEWVVVNLDAGTAELHAGPNKIYANSNYQILSPNTLVSSNTSGDIGNNQVRAPNGRIFFPAFGTNVAYFDPTDRAVHHLDPVVDPLGGEHAYVYSAEWNQDGTLVYFGTQGTNGDFPLVFSLDPITLATTVLGVVGVTASANPKYAYYLAVDGGAAPWVYVAVGQDPWELIAINTSTLAQTTLAILTGTGQNISFTPRPKGWTVRLQENGVQTDYWLGDGAMSTYVPDNPPFVARDVTAYTNPLGASAPQIDWSRGIGQVLWRPVVGEGEWTLVEYDVSYKAAIDLESLAPLPNGDVLGNARQYNGFFRRTATETTWYGTWSLGLSQPAPCRVGRDVYLAGYPNGALYRFDPDLDWDSSTNPVALGNFTASGMKYPNRLVLADNGRLYCSGRHERDSLGSGIGYYDPDTATLAGTSADLGSYNPRGLAVIGSRVVFSGQIIDASGDARLVVYDENLTELDRHLVQAGMTDTGILFDSGAPNVVLGVTPTKIYRLNIATGLLLAIVDLPGTRGAVAQRTDDRSVWIVIGTTLYRADPTTLELVSAGTVGAVDVMTWQRSSLFVAIDTTLSEAVGAPRDDTGHVDADAVVPEPTLTGHRSKT